MGNVWWRPSRILIVSDYDTIYQNQLFINKLSSDKTKRDIFKHIIDEIKNVV